MGDLGIKYDNSERSQANCGGKTKEARHGNVPPFQIFGAHWPKIRPNCYERELLFRGSVHYTARGRTVVKKILQRVHRTDAPVIVGWS